MQNVLVKCQLKQKSHAETHAVKTLLPVGQFSVDYIFAKQA